MLSIWSLRGAVNGVQRRRDRHRRIGFDTMAFHAKLVRAMIAIDKPAAVGRSRRRS
jgi:hypothetical protein